VGRPDFLNIHFCRRPPSAWILWDDRIDVRPCFFRSTPLPAHPPAKMPSVKNPNGPSRNRLVARAAKARKSQQKRSAEGRSRIAKADTKRGARPGILPSSGPRAALSSKKRRKLERKLGYAVKRRMEADGDVHMKGELMPISLLPNIAETDSVARADAIESPNEPKQAATSDDKAADTDIS